MADKDKRYSELDASRLSVAPMMDWTDRHCRMFHRGFTRRALLHTEMVTAAAVLCGDRERLLAHHPRERPLALQLGGSDPAMLAAAARIGVAAGYDAIDLNVGCPSDRVQSGCFGAALMREPRLVAECAAAMIAAAGPVPVSVKCRIGVDEQDPEAVLPAFLATLAGAGVRRVAIHARKAWLQGLSPKENREIPPLDHGLVLRMKAAFPDLAIVINGGITDLDMAGGFLERGLDGVMIGRAAYRTPALLGAADRRIFGAPGRDVEPEAAVLAMLPYIEAERMRGTGLQAVTRHMLGAFQGRPGARAWRRRLSENAHRPGAGPELVEAALALVGERAAA
ncbi:MAG TPA: tRNA dihydrouridine(20/20a) synthase DusA [Amaricoccus sp.]|uniref:tRNA dihydrouridine(20/20a) synthase DusA n=2 Tax=Amaricoccus sp. TaxID=1872485 RepID=UPI002C42FC17|nr:tRNA dihydrouridine(20/20a) synthase DusA [Amaricoccus sp.]HMQ94371.1 tRNA dihydrouridine(20/20a) synthase DusA [Amaricoccus sp.]HMR54635.1 tRNA dihydrouridine(20/20a) synthase DusA [Amaricoccus sp.]HMU01678.1 tRNA dihydrouridine(20/20a) synthase DusA [Amaricoccus sp.]